MRTWHKEAEGAPPPLTFRFQVPEEQQRGCLLCARGFPTSQALERHRSGPACGPPIDVEAPGAAMLTRRPVVKLKLLPPGADDRCTPSGVVDVDDIYLHSSNGINVLVDRHGMFEWPPTPQHAHEVEQHYSELHPCEREDMFDVYE